MNIYFSSGLLILIYFHLLCGIANYYHNYAVADVGWGIGFVLVALTCYFAPAINDMLSFALLLLVLCWGLRLSFYIYLRNHHQPEDFRYQQMRASWGKSAFIQSYFKVFILQAVILWLIALPLMLATDNIKNITPLEIACLSLAFFAFLYEAISDYQLFIYKQNPDNKGNIYQQGLWRLSRHPNYFGEILFWWSLSLAVFFATHSYYTLISPIIITLLLLKVSGVPMLEKRYQENENYRHYVKTTSSIIPWFNFKLKD